MKTFKVGEFKSKFSNIIKNVEQGDEIVISYGKKGERVAVLIPYYKYKLKNKVKLGILKNKASCHIKKNFKISDEEFLNS